MNEPSSELFQKLVAQVEASPAPTRPQAQRRHRLILAAALLPITFLWFKGLRTDLLRGSTRWAVAAAWVTLVGGLVLLARRRAATHPLGWGTRMAGLWAPALMILAVLGLHYSGAGEGWGGGNHFGCLAKSTVLALLPVLALLFVERHSDPVAPSARGLMLGTLGGVIGVIPFYLECGAPSSVEHATFGHVLPVLAMAAVGALLGRRWLAI
ncbi:MAG: DUF1109 family protein [Deltaproteobacteria bacterium]|jgi:hypothetical protein|nr:DUF1109 family protein [Deltaproteobacteria bacterium]